MDPRKRLVNWLLDVPKIDPRVWEHLGENNEAGTGSEYFLGSEPQSQLSEPPCSVGESINFTPEVIEEFMDDIRHGIMGG